MDLFEKEGSDRLLTGLDAIDEAFDQLHKDLEPRAVVRGGVVHAIIEDQSTYGEWGYFRNGKLITLFGMLPF